MLMFSESYNHLRAYFAAEPNGKHTENGSTEEVEAVVGDAEGVGKKKKNKKGKGLFPPCRVDFLSPIP